VFEGSRSRQGVEASRRSPRSTAAKIAQTCIPSMGTSETLGQLTERLEMGQGGTVHLFIAPGKREPRGSLSGRGGGGVTISAGRIG
jgi:hypothetical protein